VRHESRYIPIRAHATDKRSTGNIQFEMIDRIKDTQSGIGSVL